MRGNCVAVDRFSGGIGVKLNGTTKYTDSNNIIEFTAAEITGAHNHDGYHMKVAGNNNGQFTMRSYYNNTSITSDLQMIYAWDAGSDLGGIGWRQPSSDKMQLIIFTGDNGDDPIICQQLGSSSGNAGIVTSTITLMGADHNTSLNYLTCTGETCNGGLYVSGNINLGGRYYQQGTVGMIVGTSANGNMYWAV